MVCRFYRPNPQPPLSVGRKVYFNPMILSFHPIFEADENRLCAGRDPDVDDRDAIKRAHAVILPLGCSQSLYEMACQNCAHVFPNYDLRFRYPGKTGQIELFETYAIDHPDTIVVNAFPGMNIGALDLKAIGYPMVLKRDWGGEGYTVYWIDDHGELEETLNKISGRITRPGKGVAAKSGPGQPGPCDAGGLYWRVF